MRYLVELPIRSTIREVNAEFTRIKWSATDVRSIRSVRPMVELHENSLGRDRPFHWCVTGLVELDDPILDQPFTLRQLLRHEAGLADYGELADYHAPSPTMRQPGRQMK